MLRINDRFIIGCPAADGVAVAALALRVPVGVFQRIVQMCHQLRLNITLAVKFIAPAPRHVLFYRLVVAPTFVFHHAHYAQHGEFFFTLRRGIVQIPDQAVH